MEQKPKIEYVGSFYVYGSEAPKIQPKKKLTLPPMPRIHLERFSRIYIDPVATFGVLVAMVMLTVLILGSVRLKSVRSDFDTMNEYLTTLKRENTELSHALHTGMDMELIRETAESMGMVDASEAERFTVVFSLPEPVPEQSRWEKTMHFLAEMYGLDK